FVGGKRYAEQQRDKSVNTLASMKSDREKTSYLLFGGAGVLFLAGVMMVVSDKSKGGTQTN
ncbi:MAG: hypothetical protein QNL68_17095, partial [Akkermansiaceae bacterium]